jgi:hypothetical protein
MSLIATSWQSAGISKGWIPLEKGNYDHHGGALTYCAFKRQHPLMRLDNAPADREPKPGAAREIA